MKYDILIKSGSILDGTGAKIYLADIGIKKGVIEDIGTLSNARAEHVIDAAGAYVAPGFIDITNHSDTHLTLFRYPLLESAVLQGITTFIGGNCGGSLAPLAAPHALSAIRKWADPSQVNINWASMEEFLAQMDAYGMGINFGTFTGYGTLRRGIIGDEIRLLNHEERQKVKFLLQESVRQGSFGLSLGLPYGHESVSTTDEIIDIARVLSPLKGILKVHLRSQGMGLLAAVNEVIRIAREAEVSVHISHFRAVGKKAWPFLESSLTLIERARASGLDITFDVSPYPTTGSSLYLLIPAWARDGGFDELFKRLDTPEDRKNILEALKLRTLHYDDIRITQARVKSVVGHTLAEIAEEGGITPEEALVEVVRSSEGRVKIIGRTVSPENIEHSIKIEGSMVASDGEGYALAERESGDLVHPRSFGAFPHFWHQFVEEKKIFSPVAAIEKITRKPAERLSLADRGVVKKGTVADIAIFDPRALKDAATYENPFQFPVGMRWVVVSGVVAVQDGKHTGARAGRVIQKESSKK